MRTGADPGRSLLSMLTNLVGESFGVVGSSSADTTTKTIKTAGPACGSQAHTAGRHLRSAEHKAADALIAMELKPARQPAAHAFYFCQWRLRRFCCVGGQA